MIKYNFKGEKDRQLIIKSFNNIAFFIFGTSKENKKYIEEFEKLFLDNVSEINVFPQGTITDYLSSKTPGICRLDDKGKIIIEMLGYTGAGISQYDWIKHEGTHEFCHSFVDLLPKIMEQNQNGIIKNEIKLKNCMGMIEERDSKTGEYVGQHHYGKMFNETSMDIISSMAINCFDSNNSKTIDDILQKNYEEWESEKTSYSIFTTITRLAIAAFSNVYISDYQSIVNSGQNIFNVNVTMKNGIKKKANDFLYGIVFDQLHIEEEFDKIMGLGSYKTFCEYLDRLFMMSLEKKELPPEEVKQIMNVLPDFLNKKMNYYLKNGLIDENGLNKITSNFNRIWNSMQREYNAYFSQEDIIK